MHLLNVLCVSGNRNKRHKCRTRFTSGRRDACGGCDGSPGHTAQDCRKRKILVYPTIPPPISQGLKVEMSVTDFDRASNEVKFDRSGLMGSSELRGSYCRYGAFTASLSDIPRQIALCSARICFSGRCSLHSPATMKRFFRHLLTLLCAEHLKIPSPNRASPRSVKLRL
jgi:hypothetical protein